MTRARALGLLPVVAALLVSTSCMLVSEQITVVYDQFPNPMHLTELIPVIPTPIDLNAIPSYRDLKDKVKGLYDVAVLGRFAVGAASGPVQIELWMTPVETSYLSAAAVKGDPTAQRLWGITLAPGDTHSLIWSESTKDFDAKGRGALLTEARGDSKFSIYVIASGPATYDLTVTHPSLVFTVDAGL